MKATIAIFAGLLLSSPLAFAEPVATYTLSCKPAGDDATATMSTIVELNHDSSSSSGLSGSALMTISLQNNDGSAPFVANNVQVRGQVQNAADSANNQAYQVLFAQPAQGCNDVTYARLAIGDGDPAGSPNSYIRDAKGVYYYAHCVNVRASR